MKRVNIAHIIKEYGGLKAFAAEFGVTPGAVAQWRAVNSLPMGRAVMIANEYGLDRDAFYDPWAGTDHGRSEIMTDAETWAYMRSGKKSEDGE